MKKSKCLLTYHRFYTNRLGHFANTVFYGIYDNATVFVKPPISMTDFKTIQTTYYHRNGKVDMKGTAQIILNPDTSIYQWLGQWEKFDTTGKLVEVHTYRNGQRIWVKFIR